MDKASPVYVVDQQHRHGRMRLSLDRLFFRHSSYADVPVNADAVQVLGRPSRMLPKLNRCGSWEFLGVQRGGAAPSIRSFGDRVLAAISSVLQDVCWFSPAMGSTEQDHLQS